MNRQQFFLYFLQLEQCKGGGGAQAACILKCLYIMIYNGRLVEWQLIQMKIALTIIKS